MLQGLFNYDNPVWRFIGKFADIFLLNILWMVCSIPIVTMGASTTAVYYVTLKLVRDEEGSTVKSFFKSFKENFKQATVIWLFLLVSAAVILFDLYFFIMIQTLPSTFRTIMIAVFLALAFVWLGTTLFVFPLQCRFYNPVKRTLFNALFIALRHFPAMLGMLVIDLGIPALALFVTAVLQPFVFLFGFPLLAFINSYALVWIFDKYTPKREGEGEWHVEEAEISGETGQE
ncbi:MAG: YesL family protein [Clostridiales bacterium]|nr:YesL family protein [Clostridiales bacterium]